MNNKLIILFFISVVINILLLLLVTLFIARKGGVAYLGIKTLTLLKIKANQFEYQPYYLHQTSLFKILPKSDSEIVFLGDSITDECEWAELLNNSNIKNRGISGDTTVGVLNRLNDILESKPRKIFLMIGINDFIHYNKSAEQVFEDFKEIITKIHKESPNTKVVIQSLLPVNKTKYKVSVSNEKVMKLNLFLEELAKELSLQYIDLFSLLSSQNQLDSAYTLDGVHLNAQAYSVWKQAIEEYIIN